MLNGLAPAVQASDLKLAIVGHAFYPDLIPEILECRHILPGSVPVHLTVPTDKIYEVEARLAGIPGVTLHPCDNRGRDIGPFIQLLNSGCFEGYDAVLKIHTKRSPHLLDGEVRRKLLFAMLCGERRATARALTAFASPQTGLVGWASSWRSATPYWMGNKDRVTAIIERMNAMALRGRLGFFEGSMFWFRPEALAAIRELELNPEDFEAEAGQVDGTLHHALERCFTVAAWARGFVVRDLRGRILLPEGPAD